MVVWLALVKDEDVVTFVCLVDDVPHVLVVSLACGSVQGTVVTFVRGADVVMCVFVVMFGLVVTSLTWLVLADVEFVLGMIVNIAGDAVEAALDRVQKGSNLNGHSRHQSKPASIFINES